MAKGARGRPRKYAGGTAIERHREAKAAHREKLRGEKEAEAAVLALHPDRLWVEGRVAHFEVWESFTSTLPDGRVLHEEGYLQVGVAAGSTPARAVRQLVTNGGVSDPLPNPETGEPPKTLEEMRRAWVAGGLRERSERAARAQGYFARSGDLPAVRRYGGDGSLPLLEREVPGGLPPPGEAEERYGEMIAEGGRTQSGYERPVDLDTPYPAEFYDIYLHDTEGMNPEEFAEALTAGRLTLGKCPECAMPLRADPETEVLCCDTCGEMYHFFKRRGTEDLGAGEAEKMDIEELLGRSVSEREYEVRRVAGGGHVDIPAHPSVPLSLAPLPVPATPYMPPAWKTYAPEEAWHRGEEETARDRFEQRLSRNRRPRR